MSNTEAEKAQAGKGKIAQVDTMLTVNGRVVVVHAGQRLPPAEPTTAQGDAPNKAPPQLEPFEQEDITETDPLPEPVPEPAPEPAPEVVQVKPQTKTKGAKK